MNIYDLLELLINGNSYMGEGETLDAHKLVAALRESNAFGNVGSQELVAHTHNYQWNRMNRRRECTVCHALSEDQSDPYVVNTAYGPMRRRHDGYY